MLGKSKGVFSKKPFSASVEQATARNIAALLEEMQTADSNRKKEINAQIKGLQENLYFSGAEKQPAEKPEKDSSMLGGQSRLSVFQKSAGTENLERRLYRFLLEKYADIIEDFEKKTVGEIKALVDAKDLSVQSIASEFTGENYSFEQGFEDAARKAFHFVQTEISFIKPSVNLNFWLSPREILSEKIGDDKDLAVFLCSLLFALGDNKAEVVVAEMSSSKTHAFVMTEVNEKFVILDPSQKHDFEDFSGNKAEALEKYSFEGTKISRFIYRFNSQKYEQFV